MLTVLTGGSTAAIKGLGGLLAAQSSTHVRRALSGATPLLLPGVLSALIVVQIFSRGHQLTIDARAVGLLVAIAGVRFSVPPALILIAAALGSALVRWVALH
jgi:hypothetical protein